MKINLNWLKSRFIVFAHDVCMIPLAWLGAYWLRFNLGEIPQIHLKTAIAILPLLLLVQIVAYLIFGLYRGVWRFASLPDLLRIIKAVLLGVFLISMLLFLSASLASIPRSVLPLYALLLISFLGGPRFFYRLSKYGREKEGLRVLIVGAGQAGESIARDLNRQEGKQKYQPICFVDDRKSKNGQEIQGIRVIGKTKDIPMLAKRHAIEMIIIAMPSANSKEMRRIVKYCKDSKVAFRTLPGLNDLTSGSVKIEALREVSLADLLGRDPISLDWENIHRAIDNKTILVSGGGGSIGAEVCRQIAQLAPKKLIVVEQNEFNLYTLNLEMDRKFPDIHFVGYLTDICDQGVIKSIMKKNHIDIVFHAAAYKHVPMLEQQVQSAVKNNILGTKILADEAIAAKIEKFILISTDKAVNPTNIMGATKRAAEIFCQNYCQNAQTKFITVRFGNVLGSAGSVVPLFKQQIKSGGPLTVTHPDISRFFMTIPEATQLILQAAAMGNGGEIFVLDMGEPVKISYLAEQLIMLSGLVPGEDIDIVYTGLRPGEKLHEELFHTAENLIKTTHEKILKASYREKNWHELNQILESIFQIVENDDEAALKKMLIELVPEYSMQKESV
jgi:FlaA1/EpsC-like NDP-sugar epimerase